MLVVNHMGISSNEKQVTKFRNRSQKIRPSRFIKGLGMFILQVAGQRKTEYTVENQLHAQ
ncbi:hypothetical protein Lal_00016087 [Lupinus albus]|nr:hypothetical protein Lal_00016087 [Lupinus albus]